MRSRDKEPIGSLPFGAEMMVRNSIFKEMWASGWVFWINILLILIISVLFRIVALDHIPGINGDEAFYGVNVLNALERGRFLDHTPSGNILNPFYSGLLFVLQSFLPVSFWTLRLPALLTGLLLLPTTFYLTRGMFGREVALWATLLTAALPVNIAYARMGWDPSQITLIAVIVIYCVLEKKWILFVFALVSAYLIHPTNIFLIPLALLFPAFSFLKRSYDSHPMKAVFFCILAVIFIFAAIAFIYWQSPFVFKNMQIGIFRRAQSPDAFGMFFLDYARLFSGTTIYKYVCGSGYSSQAFWIDVVLTCGFLSLFFYGVNKFFRCKNWKAYGLLLGLVVTLVFFYLVAGNYAIRPHRERFSMFLVMPTILVISLTLADWFRGRQMWGRWLVIALCWLLLASFATNYFFYMLRTGGTSHYTFMTGEREPKKASWDAIVRDSAGQSASVLVSQWFNYNPIAYLARPQGHLRVQRFYSSGDLESRVLERSYIVTFPRDVLDQLVRERYLQRVTRSWAIRDFSGRIVHNVYRFN